MEKEFNNWIVRMVLMENSPDSSQARDVICYV